MKRHSFIHCGDLHLGCQQFNDQIRFEDFFSSFSSIIDYALENRVDFLLVAGDLFHHRNVNAHTLGMTVKQLDRLKNAGIRVIAIEGNHDKAFYLDEDSWMGFLNRQGYIVLLKPEYTDGRLMLRGYDGICGSILEEEGLRIVGLGYLGATTAQRLNEAAEQLEEANRQLEEGDNPLTIMMLHAAVDKLMGQDMAGVAKDCFEVFSQKVDYIALGHIHSRQEHSGYIFNPGAPECVHIDEVRKNQEKGFYHVTTEGRELKVQYINSVRRPVMYFDIDITGICLPDEVTAAVTEALDKSELERLQKPLAQINLYGTVDFNSFAIDEGALSECIKSRYDCLAVEILNNVNMQTEAAVDADGSFDRLSLERGVVMKMISEEKPEYREISQEIADLALAFKNNSISGVDEDELISMMERTLEGIGFGAKEELP
jgi:DNA repair exonuclease SbcCD nuclease subunit